jgi:hypothetical protein
MTADSQRLPDEREVTPWYEAVCELWDNHDAYTAMSESARRIATSRYSEAVSRERHITYFTGLEAGCTPWILAERARGGSNDQSC